ncbi:unnamed protein product, partial [Rotaria sp. Silwood1]
PIIVVEFGTQLAAVMICTGEIIAPPQKWLPNLCKDTAQPQLELTADSPPTILSTMASVFEQPHSAL